MLLWDQSVLCDESVMNVWWICEKKHQPQVTNLQELSNSSCSAFEMFVGRVGLNHTDLSFKYLVVVVPPHGGDGMFLSHVRTNYVAQIPVFFSNWIAFTFSGSCLKGQLGNSNRANLSKFSKRFVCHINLSLNFKGKMCPNIQKTTPQIPCGKRNGLVKGSNYPSMFHPCLLARIKWCNPNHAHRCNPYNPRCSHGVPTKPTQRAKALEANSKAQMFNFQLLPSLKNSNPWKGHVLKPHKKRSRTEEPGRVGDVFFVMGVLINSRQLRVTILVTSRICFVGSGSPILRQMAAIFLTSLTLYKPM